MYKISRLGNGIRVVTEKIDYVRSVSVGVMVGAGSAMENRENNGVSHYIEHMLFKGTKTRSAKEIAEYMESVGGQLNAVTAKEYTCYYAKTLDEYSDMAFEILSDMVINSVFSREMMETERKVIAEEISMCEDTPEDAIHDYLSAAMWGENSLGFPIGGTEQSLKGITREIMLDYYGNFYSGDNMVISVVGNFDEDEVLKKLEDKFGGIKNGIGYVPVQKKIDVRRNARMVKKDIEQCHICMGFESLERRNPLYYDLQVVNALLGGNMSSRLFQKVREEKGLAYSIYSYTNTYKNNGSFVIYAGVNQDNLCESLEIINNEIVNLKKNKLTKKEIDIAKTQMKATVMMGLESMSSRMSSYGKMLLFDNEIKTQEDMISEIDNVNSDAVAHVIDHVFDADKFSLAILGDVDKDCDSLLDIMKL